MICPSCLRTFIAGEHCTFDGWKLIKVECPDCHQDTFDYNYCPCGRYVRDVREGMIEDALNETV